MRRPVIHRPKNLLPMSVALLALVVAGTGTAVAATSTTTISDPTNSSYVAHVNSSGQLQVSGSVSVSAPGVPFVTAATGLGNFATFNLQPLLGPTTATLALTQLSFINPSTNSTPWFEYVYQEAAASSTSCSNSNFAHRIAQLEAAPGTETFDNLTPPMSVKPLVANQYYCLVAGTSPDDDGTENGEVSAYVTGYVQSGAVPAGPESTRAHHGAAG